jgi:hypothetical protein
MSQSVAVHHPPMPILDSNPNVTRPCPVCGAAVPAGEIYCSTLCLAVTPAMMEITCPTTGI